MGRKGSPGATSKLTSRLANFMGRTPFHVCAEYGAQGLPQVGNQVVGSFQANRQSNESVGYAEFLPDLGGYVGVGCSGRVSHEGFDAAQAFGANPKLEGVHYSDRFSGAGVQLEAQHSSKGGLLPFGQ